MGSLSQPPPEDGQRALRREQRRFQRAVDRKQARHRRFLREKDKGFWSALSSFGMVGWSIVTPTLLGIALGMWIDGRTGGGIRYTLSLLVAGLVMGMVNVWRWLQSKQAEEAEQQAEVEAEQMAKTSGAPAARQREQRP